LLLVIIFGADARLVFFLRFIKREVLTGWSSMFPVVNVMAAGKS
jgi:hypothetical protein